MADLKVTIHPLFFVFGLYFAFIGKVFSFLIFTLVALEHELGHYFASSKLGYKLNKITLLPYGAIIKGDLTELNYKDECKIALAGPLINLLTALFFVSLWWFFPPVYAYTDVIVFASLSLAVINLLPCYPLDGGRFLYATLSLYIKRKKAKQIVSALGLALSVIFLVLFIISLFSTPNVTLFFFFLFMLLGVFGGSKKNTYVKTLSFLKEEYLKSPKIVKSIAISENALVKELFSLIDNAYYYEIKICSPNGTTTLNHKEMITLLTEESVYTKIANSKIYNELLLNNKKA